MQSNKKKNPNFRLKGRSKVNFNQPNRTHQKLNRQRGCIPQKILQVPGLYSKLSKKERRYDKWNEITNYGTG